ncbi:MAG TPA: hypothetical protein VMJ10_03975 [Kofleriaceae bacterium]|nr:hypothetical protein [Kofleriaceae bacterium]
MRRTLVVSLVLVACRSGFDVQARDAPAVDASLACVAQISAGGGHTCVLRGDGTVWCWGNNALGELGLGTLNPGESPTPVEVLQSPGGPPFDHVVEISCGVEETSCALRDDGTAWCWGGNTCGQVGNGIVGDCSTFTTKSAVASPSKVVQSTPGNPSLTGIAEIVTGEENTCARMTDGTLQCWGWNLYGQIGGSGVQASGYPIQVTTMNGVLGASAGVMVSYGHTCAWDTSGALRCWGYNASGQLGVDNQTNQPYPDVVPLASVVDARSANQFTCAQLADGTMYCFGDDTDGQLGDGNMGTGVVSIVPAEVIASGSPFGSVAEIGTGDGTTCARKTDGTVWCWGTNNVGQLGIGSLTPAASASPVQVPLPAPASALAVGNDHACAVLPGDEIRCWGDNTRGQLGNGTFDTPIDLPTAAVYSCP